MESLYDYDNEEDEEPYFYSPADQYEYVEEVQDDQQTIDTLPHQLEDTVYQETPAAVPFYGDTTSKSTYTWKVPNRREGRDTAGETRNVEKIPFYSETTHRSQYVPIDAAVTRSRLSKKSSSLPISNVPFAPETTYRNLFQHLEIGKRQKLIKTCPAEKIVRRVDLLKQSRRNNGHFFLTYDATEKHVLLPTPSLKKPAQSDDDKEKSIL